jgi:hypothetical protein
MMQKFKNLKQNANLYSIIMGHCNKKVTEHFCFVCHLHIGNIIVQKKDPTDYKLIYLSDIKDENKISDHSSACVN